MSTDNSHFLQTETSQINVKIEIFWNLPFMAIHEFATVNVTNHFGLGPVNNLLSIINNKKKFAIKLNSR